MAKDMPNMWTGPVEDGRQTYFSQARHVPRGWEARSSAGVRSWHPLSESHTVGAWLQVRPPLDQEADPVVIVSNSDGHWPKTIRKSQIEAALGGTAHATIEGESLLARVWRLLTKGPSV